MKSVKVNLKDDSYSIIIGDSLIKNIGSFLKPLKLGENVLVVTNPKVKSLYSKPLINSLKNHDFNVDLITIPDSERSKSIEELDIILNKISKFDFQKKFFVLALGGGVVGDFSGFLAGIYKRGIPYVQVPTTLLAQVDSSIGGKTALDLPSGKNLIGLFYQPKVVISDVSSLKTLNLKQLRCGLAEVLKYGLIKDSKLFDFLETNIDKILTADQEVLEFIVTRCSQIKAEIVAEDEKEIKGIRTILNFGHTIGHAIEAATNFSKFTHGEAISIGMMFALDLSCDFGFIDYDLENRAEFLLKKIGLPVTVSGLAVDKIIKYYYSDKKFNGSKNKFVLIEQIGKAKIVENIPLDLIKNILRRRII